MSSEHSSDEIAHHVKTYKRVFWTLVIMTVLTVAVSKISFPVAVGVLIALIIAIFKGSLVAAFFMHLAYEKKFILAILVLTFFFFAVMIFLILGHSMDVPKITVDV